MINGMDSSAAQTIEKLKDAMHRGFSIKIAIFVTGSTGGFPCEYNLSEALSDSPIVNGESFPVDLRFRNDYPPKDEPLALFQTPRRSESSVESGTSFWQKDVSKNIPSNYVCDSLDSALIFSEDILIALRDPALLDQDADYKMSDGVSCSLLSLELEKELAMRYFVNVFPGATSEDLTALLSFFEREKYLQDHIIWNQGDISDSVKLVVSGNLMALSANEAGRREEIRSGAMIGELGLVNMTNRFCMVKCISEEAILYSMSRENWDRLQKEDLILARFMDLLVVRYLAHRVQHVSTRIFDTRFLPI